MQRPLVLKCIFLFSFLHQDIVIQQKSWISLYFAIIPFSKHKRQQEIMEKEMVFGSKPASTPKKRLVLIYS